LQAQQNWQGPFYCSTVYVMHKIKLSASLLTLILLLFLVERQTNVYVGPPQVLNA
jgi:hypothetical protein